MTAFGYVGGDPSKLNRGGYTKGDVPAADATGLLQPVAIGTGGEVLTVDTSQPEDVDWLPGGGGGGGVNSVFTRVGNVVAQAGDYTAAQVGADASGAAAAVLATSAQKAQNLADLANVVTARTNLGLGTAATQNVGAFDAAGAAAAAQAASQPLDSDLTTIAGLTATTDSFMQAKASAWSARTVAQVLADLAVPGTTFQPLDSDLTAIAGLTATTDNFIQSKASAWSSRTPAQVSTDLQAAGLAPKASPTFTGTATFARQVNTPVVLADAATILVNASLGNTFRMTLTTTGRTLGNPSSPVDGQMLLFELIQSGAGGLTLLLDTKYAFGTGITAFTMTTTANKRDFLGVFYNSTADKFYIIALAQGY